jgi:hypothetical protein
VYQSGSADPGNPVYRPMIVGDDFIIQIGAALIIGGRHPIPFKRMSDSVRLPIGELSYGKVTK